jgi:hypothetical protein
MKNHAKQIERAKGQRAAIRPTGHQSPSTVALDPNLHERRLRVAEARDVSASSRI